MERESEVLPLSRQCVARVCESIVDRTAPEIDDHETTPPVFVANHCCRSHRLLARGHPQRVWRQEPTAAAGTRCCLKIHATPPIGVLMSYKAENLAFGGHVDDVRS